MKWLQMIKVPSEPQVDAFVRKCNMRYMDHSMMSVCATAANADGHTDMLPHTSKEISEAIDSMIEFGDFALIRRELFDRGYLDRTADGREYRAKQKKLNINEQEILDFLDGS